MVVQLFLVAVYLEWIFDKNNALINSLWVLMMVIALGSTPIAEFKTKEDCEKMSVEFSTKFKNEKYICELKK